MYIGAIVTVAGGGRMGEQALPMSARTAEPTPARNSQLLFDTPVAFCEVLGEPLLNRVVKRLRASGVDQVSVISEGAKDKVTAIDQLVLGGNFWSAWDSVVSQYLHHGVEMLLLVRLGPYVEINVNEFVQFHRASASPITQAYGSGRPLDIVLVDADSLRGGDTSYRNQFSTLLPHRAHFRSQGYVNSLSKPEDFRKLVSDGLSGACAIQPVGQEVRPGVWLGSNAAVDERAHLEGPVYVGANARVGASCVISGLSSIEEGCEVDCGSSIDDCSVFPGTYVGMGLHVGHALVSGAKLFSLVRNIEVAFGDRRLIASTLASRCQVTSTTTRFLRPMRSLSTTRLSSRMSKVASLVSNRWLG
ncbi:MAG TPA: NDP-sugar synthase [Terriglobales bacterium]